MQEEAHWFESDGERLFGILHRSGESRGLVLLLHGFTGHHIGPYYLYTTLARELVSAGFDVFRFDYAGSGNSTGEFPDQTIRRTVLNAEDALRYLEAEEVDTSTMALVGHSRGGSTALLLAEEANTDAVVTLGAVSEYEKLWTDEDKEEARNKETVTVYGFEYPVKNLEEPLEYDFLDTVSRLEIPTLFVHGEEDDQVPRTHSEELYDAASPPKELLVLENSNHYFSDPGERNSLVENTVDWLNENL